MKILTDTGPVRHCNIHALCTETGTHSEYKSCIGCTEHSSVRSSKPCRHRGDVIRQDINNLCGARGESVNLFACSLHGECALGRYCHSQTVRTCLTCTDQTPPDEPNRTNSPALPQSRKVSVIIPCHNYGRFLEECVTSVRESNCPPEEIVIVDDSSTDDTSEIAKRLGIEPIRVEFRNVLQSRRAGLVATKSPYVVFLDADDKIGPTYLSECLDRMHSDESIGIVTSDLTLFGTRDGVLSHKPCELEQQNWLHAGSMVRRAAINACQAFDGDLPGLTTHDDWYIWRKVVRNGWKAVSTGKASYFYRQHAESMMHGPMSAGPYRIRARLDDEPITMFLPLSGRRRYLDRLLDFVKQTKPAELIVVNTGNAEFKTLVRAAVNYLGIERTTVIDLPDSTGLADINRAAEVSAYYGVQRIMPTIYRHLRERLATEYAFIVEDDVIPPDDALARLLDAMDHNVSAVSGIVPSRFAHGRSISWDNAKNMQPLGRMSGVEEIGGSGMGCLLLRRSAMLQVPPFHAGGLTGNFDQEFAQAITKAGWRWLIDWSVQCGHGEIEAVTDQLSAA